MFRSIVVGTDGSDTALEAVREAVNIAGAVGATLELVSAYNEPIPESLHGLRGLSVGVPSLTDARREVEATLTGAADMARRAGVTVKVHLRHGDPASAILDVAEEQDAELVVVGSLGMSGAGRFLLGSVPDKVSHHARCSVLIIKTA